MKLTLLFALLVAGMALCSAAALSEPETDDLDLVPASGPGSFLGGDDLEGAETHYRSYYYRPRYYRSYYKPRYYRRRYYKPRYYGGHYW
ncbi:hypothetical protein FJT64_008227 [Amphibalanus amphitrite]|uniref:Uncharacterized protein n=1 Tax=Amphibalanus amphitrite TaxID=1232801 RepID=A0A6A4VW20_AMPAM|nr:hypothetical protein FJT64_008227 [Amphibalanus amphitrite]